MVSIACDATERDGVTLVTARIDGDGTSRRVRVVNRLDGPVWPPRRRGVPETGWDDDGYEGVVPAGGTVGLGYASPAPPADPPLELVEADPVDDPEPRTGDSTARAAVRDLGDPSPPRDAVPEPAVTEASLDDDTDDPGPRSATARAPSATPGELPADVADWLDAVEDRVTTAERLAAAETLPAATAALGAAGGLDATEALVEDLDDDVRALEALTDRSRDLADRAAAADVPLATLERIA